MDVNPIRALKSSTVATPHVPTLNIQPCTARAPHMPA